MLKSEPITPGRFYHIYNRGINGCKIFGENENYSYFLKLYNQHISPIAETYAWVLMPNHFHFLVRVREEDYVTTPDRVPNPVRGRKPAQHFSNLFNGYAQAFNKRFNRHGALFERPFKRKAVDSPDYLRHLVLYIHNNPVHHGFCGHPMDYPWSSYLTFVSVNPTRLQREKVIGWFDDEANFKYLHNQKVEVESIEKWLELKD